MNNQASDVIKDVTARASQYGPDTFLAVVVLVIIALFVAGWFWFVVRPQKEADIEFRKEEHKTQSLLAESVQALCNVTLDVKSKVADNHVSSKTMTEHLKALRAAAELSCEVAGKLDKDNQCASELGEIKGLLK